MSKTIVIHDDHIDILKDGYNIIEQTIHLNGSSLPSLLDQVYTGGLESLNSDDQDTLVDLLNAIE